MDHALTVVAKPLVASEANHRCGLALASLAQFEHFRHLAVYLLMGAACSTKKVRRKNSLRDLMEQRNLDNLIDQWPQTYLLMLKSKFNAVSTQSGLDHNSFRKLFPNLRSTSIDLRSSRNLPSRVLELRPGLQRSLGLQRVLPDAQLHSKLR